MYRRVLQMMFILSIVLLLGTVTVAAIAREATSGLAETTEFQAARANEGPTNYIRARTNTTFTTVITVTTTEDTSGEGQTRTCYYTGGSYNAYTPIDGKCNLRRALIEASHRPAGDRPILVKFNLPLTDTNYITATDTWTVVMEGDYSSSAGGEAIVPDTILEPDGLITIDGDTQGEIGGRTDGPKVIINSENSFDVLSENNVIRNLAFNGGGGVFLNKSSNVGGNNIVENVWVGLAADGQEIVPTDNPDVSLAGGGIDIQSDNNTITGTIVTGSNIGIRIQGDGNVIQYSTIGTRGDKTVPADRLDCDNPSNVYNPDLWYGGWGIQFLSGSNNQVISNTIAAVHSPHSATETFPPAISTGGSDNYFAYNTIGIDGVGVEVGTCGQGFDVSGHNMQILTNTIVNARSSYFDAQTDDPTEGAIFINDSSPLARKYTLRNNIVRDSTSRVIEYGPAIPEALRLFDPPIIVVISDTLVVGETEVGSDCPNCLIELYLDDLGDGQDALELLTTATTENITGTARFTATLDSPLPADHGIRVTATTQEDYVIGDYLSGTTTAMSPAYGPDATYSRDLGPGWNLFSIDVTPPSPAITDVLSSLAGQYDVVLSFDGGPSGGGLTYDPNNPGASDLTTVDVTHGYWIHITAATTQTLVLDYEPARDDTPIVLYDGWNLVSFLPDRTMPITEALSSIAGTYDLVQGFDGAGKTYMPGQPQFSDLTELQPGHAYWIKITEGTGSVTLTYAGYDALRTPLETTPPASGTRQGVAVSDFFSPTTEWVDFYGVATLSGFSAPRNASVVAYDPDGVVAGAFTVHTPPYYGFLHVYADDARTPGDEGAEPGDEIRFTINGRLATPSKSTTWSSRGEATEANLEVTMPYVTTDEWSDFWGTLTLDGAPAPVGTILAAYDPDGVYIGDYILTEAGQYGFLHAYGDDATTTADEGAETGDSLTFKAFLPLSDAPIDVVPDSGSAIWQGRGSRAEINLSEGGETLPVAPSAVSVNGPSVGATNRAYTFTVTVDPVSVTLPITYVVQHTDLESPLTTSLDSRSVYLKNRTWSRPGTKLITVTADNGSGSAVGTHAIVIQEVFTIGPSGGTHTFTDETGLGTSITVAAGTLSQDTIFTYTVTGNPAHAVPSDLAFAGRSFSLEVSPSIGGPISVTLEYSDTHLAAAGIEDETTLRLYYWNGTGWDDVVNACAPPKPDHDRDIAQNRLTVPVCHLSDFALFGEGRFTVYMPLVLK